MSSRSLFSSSCAHEAARTSATSAVTATFSVRGPPLPSSRSVVSSTPSARVTSESAAVDAREARLRTLSCILGRRLRPWHDPRDVRIDTGYRRPDRLLGATSIAAKLLLTLSLLAIALTLSFGRADGHGCSPLSFFSSTPNAFAGPSSLRRQSRGQGPFERRSGRLMTLHPSVGLTLAAHIGQER